MRISDWRSDVCSADLGRMMDVALKLEGPYRNASTHAAGVVIGDRPLVELVPLYRDPHASMPATQFSMKYAEAAGLVKFDFLGLKTLDVLEKAIALIRRKGVEIDLATIPPSDQPTFDLLRSEEHTSELQSLMRISYAVFCLKKKKKQ